jgi:hypothetical protein
MRFSKKRNFSETDSRGEDHSGRLVVPRRCVSTQISRCLSVDRSKSCNIPKRRYIVIS